MIEGRLVGLPGLWFERQVGMKPSTEIRNTGGRDLKSGGQGGKIGGSAKGTLSFENLTNVFTSGNPGQRK